MYVGQRRYCNDSELRLPVYRRTVPPDFFFDFFSANS